MKAQRRHELKENDLAHALLVARDYLYEHGTHVGVGLIVVVVVIGAVGLGLRSRAVAHEDLWRRKSQLPFDKPEVGKQSLEALANMMRETKDKRFLLASLIEQGQQALRLAREVPFPPDRELNDLAKRAFEQLLEQFKDNPLAVGLAHSGLATVEENAFVLDEDAVHKQRAEAHLTAIINDAALRGLPLQRLAMDRRKGLDDTFTITVFEQTPPEGRPQDRQDLSVLPIQLEGLEGVEFEIVEEPEPVEEPAGAESPKTP
jgi:hypothetical protein